MKKRKINIMALGILTCFLILTGCGKSNDDTVWKSKEELVFGTTISTKSLDPAQGYSGWFTVRYGVAETLFKLDDAMEPIPWLAQGYEALNTTTWRIEIKENIYFQNGVEMTAKKVKESLDRVIELNSRAKSTLKIKNIEVDGKYLIFNMEEENPTLINDLCDPFAAIIDVNGTETPDSNPVGTGPFIVEKFTTISSSYLTRNNNYWDGDVKLSNLKIIPISDSDTLAMALQSGEIDIAQGISTSLMALLKENDDYKLSSIDTSRAILMYFNENNSNLNNKNVRKAINMLINKEEYAKVLLNGNATAAVGPFPKNTTYGSNVTDNSSYNKEEAIRIFTKEGYSDTNGDGILDKDGENLTLKLITYSARAELPTIAQALQADLKEVGIEVSIEISENISDILSKGSFDLCLYSNVTSSTGEPLSYLNNAMRSNGELNYGNYSNMEVDMLLDKMQLEFDIEERNNLAEEIVQKVLDDDGYNFIAHLKVSFLMKNNLVGFKAHPTDYYQFNKDTYIQ